MSCGKETQVIGPNQVECRICKNDDCPELMINPCNCSGSLKYVHKHCLLKWFQTSHSAEECNICHSRYTCSIVMRRRAFWSFIKEHFDRLIYSAAVPVLFTLVLLGTLFSAFVVLNTQYRISSMNSSNLQTLIQRNGFSKFRRHRPMTSTDLLISKCLLSVIVLFPVLLIWTLFVKEVANEWNIHLEYDIQE